MSQPYGSPPPYRAYQPPLRPPPTSQPSRPRRTPGAKLFGWVAGIAATVIATIIGAVLTAAPTPPVDRGDPEPYPVGTTVDFQLTDELGPGQVSEQITLRVDGRSVGTLTVDTVHPSASLVVTVGRAGSHRWEGESTSWVGDDGEYTQVLAAGSGTLDVSAGRTFRAVLAATDRLDLK